jgi:hypothetical protein
MTPPLRQALNQQVTQFHTLEHQVHSMATQRGWELPDLSVIAEYLTEQKIKRKLRFHKTDSQIAAIAILNNTQTMISHLQVKARTEELSSGIAILFQRYLDAIQTQIRQLQQFL